MADRVGQTLGHYRLAQLLGEGGFAEVYLGKPVHLGAQAAIKVLSAKLQRDEIDHFRDEARTIASLKHPSIVRVLDFGVEGGLPYLVMDYAPNGTLRQRHPKGTRLAPAMLVRYVRQVASALQFAHDRKLIHRDVKPRICWSVRAATCCSRTLASPSSRKARATRAPRISRVL